MQAAGGIVWRDGTTLGYLRDASPLAPEANFVRDVDFCSGAFLLLRADLLRQLEGFDEAFAPADYADADLCLRIAAAGSARGVRSRRGGHPSDARSAADARPGERRQALLARSTATGCALHHVASCRRRGIRALDRRPRRRVLFIEDMVPLRRLGSGFVRSNDLIQAMAALG